MAINTGSIFAWVVCAASVVAIGCTRRPPASQAADTLSCGAESVSFQDNGFIHIARGCGKTDVFCDSNGSWGSLRTRAGFDFGCSPNDVEITIIDNMTYGVTGCGQKATYKFAYGAGFVSDNFRPTPAPQQQTYVPPPPPPPVTPMPIFK
jgi:hypothetical protein